MQNISNFASNLYHSIFSPTDDQKKDPNYMLQYGTTWEFLQTADKSLLENETYRYKCFYVTNNKASLLEAQKNGFDSDQIIQNMLKHLLIEDPSFLLNCLKNGKNKHFSFSYLPEEELRSACIKDDNLLELIPFSQTRNNARGTFGAIQKTARKGMSEKFWIPLAKVNNKAVDYWLKENYVIRETADGRYYAILQTNNPYFFTTASKLDQEQITLLENFYHDKSFVNLAIQLKCGLDSIANQDGLIPDLTNKIALTVLEVFIQDFYKDLNKIDEISKYHYAYSHLPKVIDLEAKLSSAKSLDDLIHCIFLCKLQIVKCITEPKLRGKFRSVTEGAFKNLDFIQQIYLSYPYESSNLQRHYLAKPD